MIRAIDAGRLGDRLDVLEFQQTEPNHWQWVAVRRTWARVSLQDRRNVFSTLGVGARDASVVVRRQTLGLEMALRWGGQHLFLTAILPSGRGHYAAHAALVELSDCTAYPVKAGMGEGNRPKREQGDPIRFPGVLTQKYAGFTRQDTHASNATQWILVTPKSIVLKAGDLVEVRGDTWNVRVVHPLAAHKNEYEIHLRKDV